MCRRPLVPLGTVGQFVDRFESLFDGALRATRWYPLIYDLPDDELDELAYSFEHDIRGIDDDDAELLGAAVDAWQRDHSTSSLTMSAVDSLVVISDARQGFAARDHVLTGERAGIYLALSRHLSLPGLLATVKAVDLTVTEEDAKRYLSEWLDAGLVFEDGGFWVALAVPQWL